MIQLYLHMMEPGDRLWVITPDSPALMERIIWESRREKERRGGGLEG